MPSTYSDNLRLEIMAKGEKANTWGDVVNTNVGTLLEQAVSGVATINMADTNYTLAVANGAADEARNAVLRITGTLTTATRNVICPASPKIYIVSNETTGGYALTIKTPGGTGVSVPNGSRLLVYCDGTNVVNCFDLSQYQLKTGGSQGATTFTAPVTMSGAAFNEAQGADIAAASTINLDSATGNCIDITGNTTINAMTLSQGRGRVLRFTGTPILTHGASLVCPGGLSIQVQAGDFALVRGYASGVVRVMSYIRASSLPALTGRQTVWVPAGAMVGRLTNGAAMSTAELGTNKVVLKGFDFDQATQQYVQFQIGMPKSWNQGTVSAEFIWTASAGTTGQGVVWGLQAVAVSDNDALDVAFGSAQTATDNYQGANINHRSAETGAITVAGSPAVGDLVMFQLYRDPANGSDTLAATATLLGIRLFITTNAGNDA